MKTIGMLEIAKKCARHWFILAVSVLTIYECFSRADYLLGNGFYAEDGLMWDVPDGVQVPVSRSEYFASRRNMPLFLLKYTTDSLALAINDVVSIFVDYTAPWFGLVLLLSVGLSIVAAGVYFWWDIERQRRISLSLPKEFSDVSNSLQSTYSFTNFVFHMYSTLGTHYEPLCFLEEKTCGFHFLDVFRAFLDLHKDGWRMKIFPFSKERLAEEKRLSEERGEEYVIYPDVEDAVRRAEEADREIERIGEI